MEVKVHPADPSKVIARDNADAKWVACDNIFGEWDEFLNADEVAAREAEPFYLIHVP